MLKYLLLIVVVAVFWWSWRKRALGSPKSSGQAKPVASERMVACASCGVYLPESESVADGGEHYCCQQHRRVAADSRSR